MRIRGEVFLIKRRHFQNIEEIWGIAQLGERLNGIQEVSGSIPLISTILGSRKRFSWWDAFPALFLTTDACSIIVL